MQICCLASGSKGNSTFVQAGNTKILIDLGLSTKEIEYRLSQIGVSPSEIDAVLITHEHSDHIGGLKIFTNKYKIPVYAHINGIEAITQKQAIAPMYQISFLDAPFRIKDLDITPIRLSHDSVFCVGYSISCQGQKMSIITDTGVVPQEAIDIINGSDIIVIECNHNKQMLLNNPNYSMFLKKRILSVRGHLSNEECAMNIIRCLQKNYTSQFILAHLSENNNNPIVAFNDVKSKLLEYGIEEGKDIFIDIALQRKISKVFTISSNQNT